MEFFGFASGSSKTGPAFPYMPESVLANYPNTLLEHPAVPTAAASFLNLNLMDTPDARTLLTALQTWTEKSVALLDKQTVQAVGLGLSASVCVYGAWRISQRWNGGIVMNKKQNLHCEGQGHEGFLLEGWHDAKVTSLEDMEANMDAVQRQLADSRAKLEELRYQLTQVEGEKEMLEAEVSMRKKMVASLQGEIHTERDKRQQAELRMEMMEWENVHLRQMRKDFASKESKIDVLEASLKEKDAMHDKLFHENVILPKNIAAARAKEYESLRTKVQKYEMNAVMKRNAEEPYKPVRYGSVTSTTGRPSDWEDSTATLETALQLSDENSAASTGQPQQGMMARARNMLYSNWSNSAEQPSRGATSPGPTLGEQVDVGQEIMMSSRHERCQGAGQEGRVQSPCRQDPDGSVCGTGVDNGGVQSCTTVNTVVERGPHGQRKDCSTSEHLTTLEDQAGVLGHIRSFFSGMSHSSGSDCHLVSSPGCLASTAHMGEVLPSHSRLWDASFEDKANNCSLQEARKEKRQDEEEEEDDDVCCTSMSDGGQSSVFMSASCGSDTSDDEGKHASRALRNKSSNRARSNKRAKSLKARSYSSKRVTSPVKSQSSKRQMAGSPTKPTPHRTSGLYAPRTPRSVTSPSPNDTPFSVLTMASARDSSFSRASVCRTALSFAPSVPRHLSPDTLVKTPHQGRARHRYRPRKSRSKLTNVSTGPDGARLPEDSLQSETIFPRGAKLPKDILQSETIFSRGGRLASPGCARELFSRLPVQRISRPIADPEDANRNSVVDATDSESERSWIVITPSQRAE